MPTSETVWLAVLGVAFVTQGLAWAWVAAGIRRVREHAPLGEREAPPATAPPATAPALPISVVIAAHNEAERLPPLLDALAAQTHQRADGRPAFEVVVVDDRSADRTAQIVAWRADGFPVPLRLVRVAEGAPDAAGLPPKKHAIERGVEAAAHPRVAITDADGRPGPGWLATLAHWATDDPATGDRAANDRAADDRAAENLAGHHSAEGAGAARDAGAVLVGYGPYRARPGWLNRFVRYETVTTAALAAAAVGHGRPWHAVGRNLSYPTALLGALGGFAHSAGSLSGDDDLLVQEVARRDAAPVRYVLDANAAVPSEAPPEAGAFWRQRRRHASAGGHYPATVLAALGAFHGSNLALWVGAPLLHLAAGAPYGWGLLAAKLIVQRAVLSDVFDALGARADLRLWQPVLDALLAGYQVVFSVLGALPTPRRW